MMLRDGDGQGGEKGIITSSIPGKLVPPASVSQERPGSRAGELGVITIDARRRITGMNPAAEVLLHVNAEAFVQRPLSELMTRVCARSDVKRAMEAVQRAILAGQVSNFEIQLPGDEGSATFVRVHVSPMRGRDSWESRVVFTLEDITAYKQVGLSGMAHENAQRYAEVLQLATQLEKQKEHYRLQSIHDGLTGLYNFAHFQVLLAHEIARARRYEHPLALLMIDVDDFKSYNDAYGHPAGNWALRDVATILQHACRQTDWVARYGGEEFAVILPETDMAGALVVADRLRRAVERESQIGLWFRRPITISIGVAVYPHDATNPHELILRADERLYQAKAAGKNRVQGAEEIPIPG